MDVEQTTDPGKEEGFWTGVLLSCHVLLVLFVICSKPITHPPAGIRKPYQNIQNPRNTRRNHYLIRFVSGFVVFFFYVSHPFAFFFSIPIRCVSITVVEYLLDSRLIAYDLVPTVAFLFEVGVCVSWRHFA